MQYLTLDDFGGDLDRLGRANGNILQRIPGDSFHDGQIMVRLKKKRFVILDYSVVPTEDDIRNAALHPNVKIPNLAGKAICNKNGCSKIGVPVCLYDSEPAEPDPLYVRSGLCFTCQRSLNEERRSTDKKRKTTGAGGGDEGPALLYAIAPSNKKFKFNKKTIQLKDDAIIVNGSVPGIANKPPGENYGFEEIGNDLLGFVHDAAQDTSHLISAVSSYGGTATSAAADAAVAAAMGEHETGGGSSSSLNHPPPGTDPATAATSVAAAVQHEANNLLEHGMPPASPQDINSLYVKAFQSMNKAIFLLAQWKTSWDAAMSAATETVADPSLAASAAAVVAAASMNVPTHNDAGLSSHGSMSMNNNNNNMVSLLLAADQRNEDSDYGHLDSSHLHSYHHSPEVYGPPSITARDNDDGADQQQQQQSAVGGDEALAEYAV